jgi:hypothetical protein
MEEPSIRTPDQRLRIRSPQLGQRNQSVRRCIEQVTTKAGAWLKGYLLRVAARSSSIRNNRSANSTSDAIVGLA